jgi:PAS domain S-box-containing protein
MPTAPGRDRRWSAASLVGALAGLALVVNGALVVAAVRQIARAGAMAGHTHSVIDELQGLLAALQDAETGQRGYLLTGAPEDLEPWHGAETAALARLARLQDLTADDPAQQARIAALRPPLEARLRELRESIELRDRPGGAETAQRMVRSGIGRERLDELRDGIAELTAAERRLLEERTEAARIASRTTVAAHLAAVAVALLLLGAAIVLARSREIALQRAQAHLHRFEVVAGHSRDIVLFMRREDGRILEANAAAAAAYGRSVDALCALHIQDLRGPGTESLTSLQMDQADRGGILFETQHRRGDGSTFPVEVSSQGATVDGVRTLVSIIRDITERKRTEAQLHRTLALLAGERDRLAVTLRSIGDAVISTDAAGRVELLNGVAEVLTGWTTVEAAGLPIDRVFHLVDEESGVRAPSPVASVLVEGSVVGLANHTALRARDGTERPIADSAAPIRDGAGRVSGAVLVFRDQTEERRAESALRQSEARLRRLTEALPQLVWTAEADGSFASFNRRWREYTGQREGEESWDLVLHPDDRERVVGSWREALVSQRDFELEHRLRRADGEYRWFLRRAILLRDDDGGHRWFGTCTDIHDLKVSEEVLRQADRLKEDFLSIASHELRTPLTSLRLQTQLLGRALRGALPDGRAEHHLGRVHAQLDRLEHLVALLLDVSRINAGRVELELDEVDLGQIAREIVHRFGEEAERAGTELHLSAAPVVGRWDRARVDQILTNLVSNAIKYGAQRPVDVDVGEREDVAVVVVRDHGIGIAPEIRSRLFERFERGDNAATYQGLGLGLWIARQMAAAHGGDISVAGTAGGGATFTVSLPRQPR